MIIIRLYPHLVYGMKPQLLLLHQSLQGAVPQTIIEMTLGLVSLLVIV
jgi:hypothetical protein